MYNVEFSKDRITVSLKRYIDVRMLRSILYWIINMLMVIVRRERRRIRRWWNGLSIHWCGSALCRCNVGQKARGLLRTTYVHRAYLRYTTVQKWQSVLVLGTLMVVGSLLMLFLHIPNPTSTHNTHSTNHNIQRGLPKLELPSDIRQQEEINNDDVIRKKAIYNENAIEYSKVEGQGVPEAEFANPVDPILEKGEPSEPVTKLAENWCQYQDLQMALTHLVDGTHVFLLVIPDVDHVNLAKNTLQTIERWTKKKNVLFVCRDTMVCEVTKQHGIPCYMDVSSSGSSTQVFKIIAEILEMDYTPTYMDFESSITRPLPYLPQGNVDMVIPYGNTAKAHSFFITLNTPASLRFHRTAIQEAEKNVNKSFAAVFKSVLDALLKKRPTFKLASLPKCTRLPVELDCSVTRHPTFSSLADRELWLKDKQLWFADTNGYYTDPKALYISYENTFDMGKRTIEYAVHALQNALAYAKILNRIVILPKFFCPICVEDKCKQHNCLLSHFMNMTRFDQEFGSWYREHSFRGHPLVPVSTKRSVSEAFLVSSALHKGMLLAGGVQTPSKSGTIKVIMPNDIFEGPNSDEVFDLFEKYATKHKILVFANFYGAFSGFTSANDSLEFEMKLKKGIVLLSKT